MLLAQRQMYMILTIMVLILEFLLIFWKILSDLVKFDFDDAFMSECIDEWHYKDSNVTYLLTCFMISMPIQQFTSCFYVIPSEHGFFKHDHNEGSKSIESPSAEHLSSEDSEEDDSALGKNNLEEVKDVEDDSDSETPSHTTNNKNWKDIEKAGSNIKLVEDSINKIVIENHNRS